MTISWKGPLKIALVLLALALAAGLFFLYSILPGKVAESILARAKVHRPVEVKPDSYGLAYEPVAAQAGNITLSGWWIPSASRKKEVLGTVLLTHGAFKSRDQVFDRAVFLAKSGYQVLLFDQRGCGLSGESPLTGGIQEAGDFSAWASFLKQKKRIRRPLVAFGFSMGAMAALRDGVVDKELDGVVADSPLANLGSYVSRRTLGGRFAAFPWFLDRCLAAYDALSGLDLKAGDLDMVPVVGSLHEVPVLYFSGEKDDLAKPEDVRKLFSKTASRHRRLVYIPDAGHEETYEKYPIIYRKAVVEFLEDLRAGFPEGDFWAKNGAYEGSDGKGSRVKK